MSTMKALLHRQAMLLVDVSGGRGLVQHTVLHQEGVKTLHPLPGPNKGHEGVLGEEQGQGQHQQQVGQVEGEGGQRAVVAAVLLHPHQIVRRSWLQIVPKSGVNDERTLVNLKTIGPHTTFGFYFS